MRIDDDTRKEIELAHTKHHGFWLFYADGAVTSGIHELNGSTEYIAPPALFLLDLYVVEHNDDGVQTPRKLRCFLRREDMAHLGNTVGELILKDMLPETATETAIWMVGDEGPEDLQTEQD